MLNLNSSASLGIYKWHDMTYPVNQKDIKFPDTKPNPINVLCAAHF